MWDPCRIYQQRQLEMVQRRAASFVYNRYRQTSSVTNMMAGLDWEPLVNSRRAFRMFMFYQMHSGLVTIHPTLYLTPRQYHTSHKYYTPPPPLNRAVAKGPVGPAIAGQIIEPVICKKKKKNWPGLTKVVIFFAILFETETTQSP